MSKVFPLKHRPTIFGEEPADASDPDGGISRLELVVYVAAFALLGLAIAVAGWTLLGGPIWFAAIPVSAATVWYVGTHTDYIAAFWASSIGAGPVLW